jgi:hypothetical protein
MTLAKYYVQYSDCTLSAGQSVNCTIVTGALKVHSVLGPGWLESAYQACLFTNSEIRV